VKFLNRFYFIKFFFLYCDFQSSARWKLRELMIIRISSLVVGLLQIFLLVASTTDPFKRGQLPRISNSSIPSIRILYPDSLKVPSKISHPSVSLQSVLQMKLIAGGSSSGNSGNGGQSTSAQITAQTPWVDSIGNIYTCEGYSVPAIGQIRKISPAGIITAFGGTSTSSATWERPV
jgi:hypothetical protein